ncbi:MAG: NAD(P)-dependent oxidoreductase [Candidatus Margulisiibacteriota bacterium]
MKKKIFITGISGCVGHYLFDVLANNPDYELYLLTRNPRKIRSEYHTNPNIEIIRGELKNIERHSDLIKQMDIVIHMAAIWGEQEGNLDYSLDLFKLLNPEKCKKVIYFSTASILDTNNQPLKEAEKLGTHYIRGKYLFYKKLPELNIHPNVITLFPTWVLGGDHRHPYSHASAGMLRMQSWLWLIRFFTIDASFHFIHARDIANIVKYLLENETQERNFVLGNRPITVSKFVKETCHFFKKRVYFQIPIFLPLVKMLAFLTNRKLHPWDLFCFEKRHFQHKTVSTEYFGLKSELQSVEQILSDLVRSKGV